MPKRYLTDQFIRNLSPKRKRVEYYDQHLIENNQLKGKGVKGLFIRLTEAGSIFFYYRYYFNKKYKSYKVGSYPDISLSDARDRARELASEVNRGIDPQAEKNKRKHKPDPQTLAELANEFKAKHLPTLRETTQEEYRRIIDFEILPTLGKYPIKGISKNQIINLLDKKAYGKKPAPVMANRIRARLSKIYSFAVDRDLAEVNPIASVPRYKKTGKGKDVEKKRSRYYNPEEIRDLWTNFEKLNEPTQSVFKMLLITGQRKTETMKMKWNDIRGDVWTIPAELAKSKEEHLLPLPDMALGIIEKMRSGNNSNHVFASPKLDDKPLQSVKRAVRYIKKDSGVSDFRPHDLRRTVATYMAKLNVQRTVLGKILNHKGLAGDDQVTAIYDRHGYLKEKRQAMNLWNAELHRILTGKKANIHKIG